MSGQGPYDRGIAPDGKRLRVGDFVRIAGCDVWWFVDEVWPYVGQFVGLAECTTRWPMLISEVVERGRNAFDLGREEALRRREETAVAERELNVETEQLVIERAKGCKCKLVQCQDGHTTWDKPPCTHGSRVRFATAVDHAEELGLNEEALRQTSYKLRAWGYDALHAVLAEAACRVRESQEEVHDGR